MAEIRIFGKTIYFGIASGMTVEEMNEETVRQAEWQKKRAEIEAEEKKESKTTRLCILMSSALEARARAGMWSETIHEKAHEDAIYMLDMIENPKGAEVPTPDLP